MASSVVDSQVTKRLFTILVLMLGLICVFGGYMLGRRARPEIKRNDLLTYNLTVSADSLYKKAKKISPKVIYNHDPEKIRTKLLAIFDCGTNCGCPPDLDNVADFIKHSINFQILRVMRTVANASLYLDSLR